MEKSKIQERVVKVVSNVLKVDPGDCQGTAAFAEHGTQVPPGSAGPGSPAATALEVGSL